MSTAESPVRRTLTKTPMKNAAKTKPMSDESFARLVKKARMTNATRDATERQYGDATPADCGPAGYIRTAMAAIEAGIKTSDVNALAEGYAMLDDCWRRLNAGRN